MKISHYMEPAGIKKYLSKIQAGFLSGFWSRGVEMSHNVLLGGQSYIIFLRVKLTTN